MAHPTDDHLMAYADGSLSSGMSLLVACHLTFCPACRAKLARIELVGGALMAELPAPAVRPPALEAVLGRLDAAGAAAARDPGRGRAAAGCASAERGAAAPEPLLPRPLQAALGVSGDAVRWRPLLPRVAGRRLAGSPGEDVWLLRVAPRALIPAHTHEGEEATLVLSGEMRDGERRFRRGDVSIAGSTVSHRPEVVPPETCVCLVVLGGRLRLTGPLGRLLDLLR